MGVEFELKFAVGEAAILALRDHSALAGEAATARLRSTYFDTRHGELREAGYSLRVRDEGGRLTQTLKRAGAGATRRGEWERLVAGPGIDAAALAETPIADRAGRVASRAQAVFVTDVERRVWRWRAGTAEIQIALDKGEIRAGPRCLAVRELELELKAGPPSALIALARQLVDAAPLRLAFDSKAERGWRLAEDALLEPRHGSAPALEPAADAAEGFRALARSALAQAAVNLAVLGEVRRPEAVHQARVALRRLRAMQAAFRGLLAADASQRIEAEIRWLAGELDCVRDLDVFARETFVPAARALGDENLAPLGRRLEGARDRAYGRMAVALAERRLDRLLFETLAWIEAEESLAPAAAPRPPLAAFAREALDRLGRAVRKRGAHFDDLDAEGRHKLRIRAKRLRYAVEAFAPLFPHHSKRRRGMTAALAAMQSVLGALNDLRVARERLGPDLGAEDPVVAVAAGRVIGRREADEPKLLAEADKAVKRFARARPFW